MPNSSAPLPDPQHDPTFRSMIEQIADYAVFMMDADGVATTWNQGVRAVLGYDEDEFIGGSVRELIFTDNAIADGVPEWEFTTAQESGSCTDDRWMKRKDGTTFWASGITSTIEDGDGNVVGFSKIMRDLTHRKDADDQIRQLNAELSVANKRQTQFLATLAHELRNPLSPVTSSVALLKSNDDLPQDAVNLCEIIARHTGQLVRLVDDLVDLSRISRNGIELRRVDCRLQPILQQAVESAQPFIVDSCQSMTMDIPEEPIYVNADPARMAQVFTNVLNNAVKYTPKNGKIHLSVVVTDQLAIIRVEDNGIGIAPDKIDQVFDVFMQADVSKERGKAGLGIGLSLVKTLVQLHGGEIRLNSDGLDQGTVVTLELPTIEVEHVDRESDHEERREEMERKVDDAAAALPKQNRRVLIVDDVYAISFTLSRLIENMGHTVETATSGIDALAKIDEFNPNVIFSDISMPQMNGYDLAIEVRRRYPAMGITLVAMTGHGQAEDRERATQAGFDHHMVKPPDARVLAEFFRKLF